MEQMFGHGKESEEEMLIRTGQMTPFGTIVKGGRAAIVPESSVLLQWQQATNSGVEDSSIEGPSTMQPFVDRSIKSESRQTICDGEVSPTSGLTATRPWAYKTVDGKNNQTTFTSCQVDGRSVVASTSSRELVSQVPPPKKRRKKVQLGTVTRRMPRMCATRNSLLGDEFLLDPEMSDFENGEEEDFDDLGESDDEYRPDAEDALDSEEDDADRELLAKGLF